MEGHVWPNPVSAARVDTIDSSKVKIVVIEQHAAIRELLVAALERSTVFAVAGQAGTGKQASSLCRRLRPSVAIVGLPLADMSGAEAVRSLREVAPQCRPVVFSGLTDEAHIAHVLRTCPNGFVDKREPLAGLWSALAAAVSGAGYFSPAATRLLRQPAGPFAAGSVREPELSPREYEVLSLVASGLTSKAISVRLGVAVRTVDNHRARMKNKLGTSRVADLTRFALKAGLVTVG